MDVHVGEKKGDVYTFDFRSVQGGSGGNDPFAISAEGEGAALSRIESKLGELEAKMNKMANPAAAISEAKQE